MNLDDITRRVRLEGQCWHWTGTLTARGVPQMYVPKRGNTPARRVIYERVHRVTLGPHEFASFACDDPQCVAPKHILICDKRRYMQLARERGVVYIDARSRAKIAVARRAHSDINMAIANAIRQRRAAGERGADLAREYQISEDRIYLISRNKQWAEPLGPLALLAQQAGML